MPASRPRRTGNGERISLFLCGDVMTGRGIDQALRHSVHPRLYEPYVRDARRYVELAEAENGPIVRPLEPDHVWGDALPELARVTPAARIVNLETAVTTSEQAWPRKGIHYRMHPANVDVLRAAEIDCCVLANNHVLDWSYPGLDETLRTLNAASIATTGAGRDRAAARLPAALPLGRDRRLLVFALASVTSGVPGTWAAGLDRPGIDLLEDLSTRTADRVADRIGRHRRDGDLVVVSVHWGDNWGFEVPESQRAFARSLIDRGAADLVHGHSSHHVKGIEVYRDRPILYGCGDFINDYEGIGGYAAYRGDLSLMYFPALNLDDGSLAGLTMVPLHMRRFRLEHAAAADADWLLQTLNREGRRFGTEATRDTAGRLALHW